MNNDEKMWGKVIMSQYEMMYKTSILYITIFSLIIAVCAYTGVTISTLSKTLLIISLVCVLYYHLLIFKLIDKQRNIFFRKARLTEVLMKEEIERDKDLDIFCKQENKIRKKVENLAKSSAFLIALTFISILFS